MTFDELKKTWQDSQTAPKLTIDSEMLLREVKGNQDAFESSIFWRDFREVAVALIMFVVIMKGAFNPENNIWIIGSLVVVAISMLYVAGFFIVDRHIQKRKRPRHNDPLLACVESSLIQVNHQIWLLKNVLWWYLLIPGIAMMVFFIVVLVDLLKVLPVSMVLPSSFVGPLILVLIFGGIYWLNQLVVRKGLIPRKQELEELLKGLANSNKII